MSRPDHLALRAIVLAGALAVAGCGKGNLARSDATHPSAATATAHPAKAQPSPPPEAVGIPLKLTAARAAGFARAVNLRDVDVPGSRNARRVPSTESRPEETAECKHEEVQAIGGGRSQRLERGHEVEGESISSSVVVMPTPGAARSDLAYAESKAGLNCYSKLLGRKLTRESNSSLSIRRVRIAPLHLRLATGEPTSGIRIEARIRGIRTGLAVELFVDVVAFQHGPAEIELYATSFVQPVPTSTEQDLLAVMRGRARRSRL